MANEWKLFSSSSDCHHATAMSSDAGNSSSSADRDFSLNQSSSVPSRNDIFYHNFMWNNSSDENPCDSSGGEVMMMISVLLSRKIWKFGWILQMICCIW